MRRVQPQAGGLRPTEREREGAPLCLGPALTQRQSEEVDEIAEAEVASSTLFARWKQPGS